MHVLQRPSFYYCHLRMKEKPQVTEQSPAPHPTATTRVCTHASSRSTCERNRAAALTCLHDTPRGPELATPEAPAALCPLGTVNWPRGLLPGCPQSPQAMHLHPGLLLSAPRTPCWSLQPGWAPSLRGFSSNPGGGMAGAAPHPDCPPCCLPVPGLVSLCDKSLPAKEERPTHRSRTPAPVERHSARQRPRRPSSTRLHRAPRLRGVSFALPAAAGGSAGSPHL